MDAALRQTGVVRARYEEFLPEELEANAGIYPPTEGAEVEEADPFFGLKELLESLEQLNGTRIDRRPSSSILSRPEASAQRAHLHFLHSFQDALWWDETWRNWVAEGRAWLVLPRSRKRSPTAWCLRFHVGPGHCWWVSGHYLIWPERDKKAESCRALLWIWQSCRSLRADTSPWRTQFRRRLGLCRRWNKLYRI